MPTGAVIRGDLRARCVSLDPRCEERLYKAAKELPGAFIREIASVIKQLARSADIRFRLQHRRHIRENHRLPQMMVGAKPLIAPD